ncbi:DUF4177 domain-containing protein [uncultured Paracoccus sp.]|uniref:DUF4177 domain-containing protein n=1 Tax=uncultured Paracoccus sp. TaxID=189685 RepID=UPI00260DB028|nr:DUF4177 domain-containing protein [uncultured Paracoccus sp.]
MRYEYTVIPAPARGDKAKGAKTPVDRFALSLTAELNRMAAEGWDYVRAETLPTEERSGLTGRSTLYHNVLVFRRPVAALETAAPPLAASQPQPEYPVSATPARAPEKAPEPPRAAAPQPIDHTSAAETPATPPAPRVTPAGS